MNDDKKYCSCSFCKREIPEGETYKSHKYRKTETKEFHNLFQDVQLVNNINMCKDCEDRTVKETKKILQ